LRRLLIDGMQSRHVPDPAADTVVG
jgi:hypothetical protein